MPDTILLLQELAEQQRRKLLECGKSLVPGLTDDDLWQPNDFPVLENHPLFRYEEGLWAGILTAIAAVAALEKDNKCDNEETCQKSR